PLQWLADHLAELPPLDELIAQLSLAGDKVEGVERRGLPAEDGVEELVVAGLVLEAGKHPNADRLQFCHVDVGEASPRPIVCGAWNFAAGDTVAVALPGTVLLDGRRISRSKLRGETSDGMILSERELDISPEGDGIIVLGDGWKPGEPLASRMPLAHDVLELEVTSNRADLLSMRGVARDVHAIFGIELAPLDDSEPAALGNRLTGDWIKIGIEDYELCPRFTARVFQDVKVAPSPLWLKARLNAVGLRPISNVVDITNYVMHDLGSPLHAYDHARVRGGVLVARHAQQGETIRTLDGQERELDPSMLVIADAEGPQGIAGIMGAADSEVREQTSTVVLEAANFTRSQILRTSQAVGLRSDASNRWEKGVPADLAPLASRAAARLLVSLCGAHMTPRPIDVSADLPSRLQLRVRMDRVAQITALEVSLARAVEILDRLGFDPRAGQGTIDVRVPTTRFLDVTREIDGIEEIARIYGLEHVPSLLSVGSGGGLTPAQRVRRTIADACLGAGLTEAQTLSYVPADTPDALGLAPDDPRRDMIAVLNPLSQDHSHLRTLILPSLLDALRRNAAWGRDDLALFEIAHTYHRVEDQKLPREPWTFSAVMRGRLGGAAWRRAGEPASFFLGKGVLESILGAVGVSCRVEAMPAAHDPFLHPGRKGFVQVPGEQALGFVGELHPLTARRWGFEDPIVCMELDLDRLCERLGAPPRALPLSEFPPLRQDIAVVVGDDHPASAVVAAAREAGGELRSDVQGFDVWRESEALGAGRRSLALRLTFQAQDRTLSDEEVRPVREAIVERLGAAVGAELRS
ncbi:MAG: phenylalanyl-tRNA synthetase beta chain, partial [Gaiellales bacterium]|nr:phenylalanyl-tRNA synthetase beta chain [Gaiellales bacterium]